LADFHGFIPRFGFPTPAPAARVVLPGVPGRAVLPGKGPRDEEAEGAASLYADRDELLSALRRQLLDPEGRDSPRRGSRNWDIRDIINAMTGNDGRPQMDAFRNPASAAHIQPQPAMTAPGGGVALPPMIPPAAAMPAPAALADAATPMTPDLEGMRGAAMGGPGMPALSTGGGVPMITGINPGAPAPGAALPGMPPNLLSASAGPDPLRAALAGGAPQPPAAINPAAPGAQPELRSYEDRLKAAMGMLPKPPELPAKSSVWDQIMRFGLATSTAGERPGATLAGSVGRGGLAVMDAAEREEDKRLQAADRIYAHHVAAVQVANSMARGEGAEVLAQRDDERKDRQLSQSAQVASQQLKMHYDQMGLQARENGLNRANQVAIARLNRESASLDRDAQRGSTEAIALLNAQATRDKGLTDTIEKTINAGKRGAGNMIEAYTPEEAAAKRREIIMNSPGTTLNEQLRTSEAMSNMQRAHALAMAETDPEKRQRMLDEANAIFERLMKQVQQDRLKLNK
jgi:hypothetical protein